MLYISLLTLPITYFPQVTSPELSHSRCPGGNRCTTDTHEFTVVCPPPSDHRQVVVHRPPRFEPCNLLGSKSDE